MRKKWLFVIFLMTMLVVLPMATYAYCGNPSSSNGVVSLWKFDDDVLDSIGSNDGTRYNFTDGYVSGKYGQALDFNSTAGQFVDVGNDSSLNFGYNDFSIDLWIKLFYQDSTVDVLGKSDANSGYGIDVDGAGFPESAILNDTNGYYAFAITNITDGNWHHVVGVRNATHTLIYVDAVFEDDESIPITNVNNTENLLIGYTLFLNGLYFNGTIDNVKIWNRALTADEILDLYENDNLGSCGVNYTELDINHTSYVRCLTNDTLHMSEWSAYGGVYYPHNKTEWCDNGCDNTTNTCNPPEYQQNLIIFVIIIAFIIAIVILLKRRRR